MKYAYEIDPYNNLVLSSGKKASAKYFRKVVQGKFRVNQKNQLEYVVRKPLSNSSIPKVIRLKGIWSLTKEHNLKITVEENKKFSYKKTILKGQIVQVGKNSLVFSLTQKDTTNKERIYSLSLNGFWHLDKYNRISFKLQKEKGQGDDLLFACKWQVNKNNVIEYVYKKKDSVDNQKTHSLLFKGKWSITEKNRLSYDISTSTDSSFQIKTSLQKVTDKDIKVEIGIGLGKNRVRQHVTFFGKWKVHKKNSLFFEFKHSAGAQKYMKFSWQAQVYDNNIKLMLKKYMSKKDLDLSFRIKKKISKTDGQMFVEAFKKGVEKAVFVGFGGKF
jgi:hypothetical protein